MKIATLIWLVLNILLLLIILVGVWFYTLPIVIKIWITLFDIGGVCMIGTIGWETWKYD